MTVRSTILAVAAALGLGTSAFAAPLAAGSQLAFTAYAQAVGSVSMASAMGLDFVNGANGSASIGSAGQVAGVGTGSGSFQGVTCATGACGSIQDLTRLSLGTHPIASFVSLAGAADGPITFDLGSITRIDRASGTLSFVASGTLHDGGFDPTAGFFTFSAQGDQVSAVFSTTLSQTDGDTPVYVDVAGSALLAVSPVDVSAAVVEVPEPVSWAMMLAGLPLLLGRRLQRQR